MQVPVSDDLVIIADSLEECFGRLLIYGKKPNRREGVVGLRQERQNFHDLQHRPESSCRVQVSSQLFMCCLSYRSRQQHLLQWLQTLDA